MTDAKNYDFTVQWLKVHDRAFSEFTYSDMIATCVRRAAKRPLYELESIKITESEMDKIQSIKDKRLERLMFVLLCMAKFQRDTIGFDNNLVDISVVDLFRMAHMTAPVDKRDDMLHELMLKGMISFPQKIDSCGMFVNIVDESDRMVIEINQTDAQDLSLAYQAFVNPKKFTRCSVCKKIIRANVSDGICDDCANNSSDTVVIKCVDCGATVQISPKATIASRCPECKLKHKRQVTAERVRRWRQTRLGEENGSKEI